VTLAEAIAARIDPALLERVVFDRGILDANQRASIFKATGLSRREIAERTVRAAGDRAETLAFGLYEQVVESDSEAASLLSAHFDPRGFYNLQANIGGGSPSLPLVDLTNFFLTVKRHICLIVARKGQNAKVATGTGFLVGPDLVLTCQHVLKAFSPEDQIDQTTNRIDLYFDFLRGDRVENFSVALPQARRVTLAAKWHVADAKSIEPDGIEDDRLTATQQPLVAAALDFMLLRLSEPVGLQPLEFGGGPRRMWISLPDDAIPQNLQENEWILVPQHPEGFPLRLGWGKFKKADPTGTRIRYTAGTSRGSSGAPCFNQKFKLVGIHNAFVGPEANPVANQAIRLDHIAVIVRPSVNGGASGADAHAPRWSVARTGESPQVILGRNLLIDWLRASASTAPAALKDRVYVAYADLPGAGCSFSSDVLHAEIRDTKTPRAVYGRLGQQLPAKAEDFLTSLLREFGIDIAGVEKMPPRPGPRAGENQPPQLAGEFDKLALWLSDDLPSWLARVLDAHVTKMVDRREGAQNAVKALRQIGEPVPQSLADQAAAPDPVMVRQNPWDYAYVLIDDLRSAKYQGKGPRTELRGEVLGLIAALIQGKAEQAMPAGLRRLRWMLLGDLPDFLQQADATRDGATVERLDPTAVDVNDVLALLNRLSQACLVVEELTARLATAVSKGVLRATQMLDVPPEARLATMQLQVNAYLPGLLKEVEP
jgi:Trypsin-like peptidase domain